MNQDTRTGFGCLFLFALPFAAVGVGALYLMGTSLWDVRRDGHSATLAKRIAQLYLAEGLASELERILGR